MTEYEFTLPDGTKRYEIVSETQDVWDFIAAYGAVKAVPVRLED